MKFERAMFWVQIHNLSLLCMTRDICDFLGGLIGGVVEVDSGMAGNCYDKYLRNSMKFGSWFRASSPPKNRAGKPVGSGNTFPLKSFVHGQGVGADLIINSTASQEVGVVRPVKNENNYSPNSSVHRQVMRAAVSFNPAIVQEGGAIDLSPLVNNGKRLMRCEIVANDQAVSKTISLTRVEK
ncbi:hypothetical protein ACOSQ4_002441 [Xanthoceras sorbifolium]